LFRVCKVFVEIRTTPIVTKVATYFANALVGGVSNPDLEQKT